MTAADIFREQRVYTLPFNPADIARKNNIRIVEYLSIAEAFGCTCEYLEQTLHKDGFTIKQGDVYVIAFNDKIASIERQRWTLTHELSHIFLGHLKETGENIHSINSSISFHNEKMADILTAQLLAPLVVLHFCAVYQATDIKDICKISMQAAENRFSELCAFRRSDKVLLSREDAQMVVHFMDFISSTIATQATKKQQNARYKNIDILGR